MISDQRILESEAISCYKKLFCSDSDTLPELSLSGGFPILTTADRDGLEVEVTSEEVRRAVFSMGPFKALGQWDTVGDSVVQMVKETFASRYIPEGINSTLIVLIPKFSPLENFSQLRPISLCNVLYKTITKVIANRVRPLMQKLVNPAQSSFIPGRCIIDNIIIVTQEIVHFMSKGVLAIKIDFQKAYDRVIWEFL